jgi:RNA polymerase sigma-70 factor, ECF subfamily
VASKRAAGEWEALMRAGLAGDAASYRRLLAEIAPFVRAVVRRSFSGGAPGHVDVEDVVQDVLLAVHLKRHTWDPALPLVPWLGAVTRHKAIDAFRRGGGRVMVPMDDLAEVLAAPAPPEPVRGDTERMLGALNERQRRIVRAIALDERTAADVGRELGMNESAVRVALHRALKLLAVKFRARET